MICRRKSTGTLSMLLTLTAVIFSATSLLSSTKQLVIIGGGMAAGIEAYYAYAEAEDDQEPMYITIYEKNASAAETTSANISPSLTPDEIISVVPRGPALGTALKTPFDKAGGVRVSDVPGINESEDTKRFTQEADHYSSNELVYQEARKILLDAGKLSMDLWDELFISELREILISSNFNPCHNPSDTTVKKLHDGYRIDLIYNIPHAKEKAHAMKADYEQLGYHYCTILSPDEVLEIDPFLKSFCEEHSVTNGQGKRVWKEDAIALWRPGGCLDARTFLPRLYDHLEKSMGTDDKGESFFQINYGKKVVGIEYAPCNQNEPLQIVGLVFEDGQVVRYGPNTEYVFCPGESVGTLKKLGFKEAASGGFAGASLTLTIDIPADQINKYASFGHCMEVHQPDVVLAWQARSKDGKVIITVAGTKAFYSDQYPHKDQAFAKNRNLLQLTMINTVLPELVSLALGYDTKGKAMTEHDMNCLESKGIARRWVGVRSVAYDGCPSVGFLYKGNQKVINARCTTHLGSGGVSFAPVMVQISRNITKRKHALDPAVEKILSYFGSARTAMN